MLDQTFKIVYDYERIDDTFRLFSPFRLKNDIKDIADYELEKIAVCVGDELNKGEKNKSVIRLYVSSKNYKIYYAKIKTEDNYRQNGKSNGYRCIVLVDESNFTGYILHIYRHKNKDNISKDERNKLRKLTDEYANSLR